MRQRFSEDVERGRLTRSKLHPEYVSAPGERVGFFLLHCVATGRDLKVLASCGDDWQACGLPGEPWEHVSVSIADSKRGHTPTWKEMCWVKSLFFEPEECVVQYHPPASVYVNTHPGVLHLWKMRDAPFPIPPVGCV